MRFHWLTGTDMKPIFCAFVCLIFSATLHAGEEKQAIDERSYNLGIIGGFSEVVRLGIKTLALSEVLPPDDMDGMMDDVAVIADRNGVKIWREPALIVTDLYPADVASGKDVLLIYTGDTLERYQALKAEKAALVAENRYSGAAREDIARRFGRLLSYPEAVIDDLLKKDKLLEQ